MIERLQFDDEGGPLRLPPQSEEAEQAVLGSVLLDREVVARCQAIVRPADFYRERNGAVWAAMVALYERGEPVDLLTILEELDRTARLEQAGGPTYLAGLLGAVPSPINAEAYAEIVARCAAMRRLISAGGKIANIGFANQDDVEEALARAEAALADVAPQARAGGFVPLDQILGDVMDELSAMRDEQGLRFRVPTGHPDLDKLLGGGLARGTLTLLAARPGMGKSSLAMGAAARAAIRYGAGVAVFSLEMGRAELAGRLVASESGLELGRLRNPDAVLSPPEQRDLGAALGRLADARIWIDDTPGLAITAIRARARQIVQREQVDLILVDHMQLVQPSRPGLPPTQAMGEISFALKALARDLNVPVLALSQLSREVEKRTSKIPMLSDLRDSGTLEQDADVVIFIYREDRYNPESARAGVADLLVEKHRNGRTGQVALLFNGRLTRFQDLADYLP